MYNKEWVVYCKEPFKNANSVIQYLGRYTPRVAILTRTKIYKNKKLPTIELIKKSLGKDFNLCPQCKKGHMLIPNTT